MRPYVFDNMICEICNQVPGIYLCPESPCLIYYCGNCWSAIHGENDMKLHKPVSRRNLSALKGKSRNQAPRSCANRLSRGYCYFQQANEESDPVRHSYYGGTCKLHLYVNKVGKVPYYFVVRTNRKFWNSKWLGRLMERHIQLQIADIRGFVISFCIIFVIARWRKTVHLSWTHPLVFQDILWDRDAHIEESRSHTSTEMVLTVRIHFMLNFCILFHPLVVSIVLFPAISKGFLRLFLDGILFMSQLILFNALTLFRFFVKYFFMK